MAGRSSQGAAAKPKGVSQLREATLCQTGQDAHTSTHFAGIHNGNLLAAVRQQHSCISQGHSQHRLRALATKENHQV